MGEKLVVGPINRGQTTNRTPFVIDNDSFPMLVNAYQWRGRVKRKRGTSFLCRLQRTLTNVFLATFSASGSGIIPVNIFSLLGLNASQPNAMIVPGTVANPLTIVIQAPINQTLTDTTGTGILAISGGGSVITAATLNYATGDLILTFSGAVGASNTYITFSYYPTLPVMGLEFFSTSSSQFPTSIAFDTIYSYAISPMFPYNTHDVSFYKNPQANPSTLPGYVPKSTLTPLVWNGQDYQQFWTTNYEGAMWATNGINIPFNISNIGMQYKPIVSVDNITTGPPAIARLHINSHGLIKGDFVFVNEVQTTTGINFQTGYVVSNDPQNVNFVDVEFPNATISMNGTLGIAQYLTNNSDSTMDCLRFYDGDPTGSSGLGWVNFCPPLSEFNFSVGQAPQAQYYLIGARMIIPFKDRLLFLGPVIQSSSAGSQIYLQDSIIFCQNGTPYYTASFTNSVTSATTLFNPILVPINQTATANAYFEDQTGYGGFRSAGLDQPIIGAGANEDSLIVQFPAAQTNFVFTADDFSPFDFYLINTELGTGSTFSTIVMDKGILSRGQRGYTITSQVGCERIDLDIPDQFGEVNLLNNGNERFCSQRDFLNEWVYFTYPSNMWGGKFPDQTLQFNYRDNSWAIFNECYTTYGTFIRQNGLTWGTVGMTYPTWGSWNVPWNASQTTILQPDVIAGNQQGFVLVRDDGTNEGISLAITNIVNSTVTCINHELNTGDYIIISECIGTVASSVNGVIFSIVDVDDNTFTLNKNIPNGLTYGGLGVITRMYVPFIQTKQFPLAWSMMRKTRLSNQAYLLTTTDNAQITLNIYLSQDSSNPYNSPPSDATIYQTTLFTCVESCNLGLTPFNTNLQMISTISNDGTNAATPSAQLWHRINTSLIGDTVQLGFTLNDDQMRAVDINGNPISQFAEIELHAFILDVSPSSLLA